MGRVWENPIDPDVPGFSGGWFAIWHLPDSVYAGAFAAKYGGQAGQARSGERTSDIRLYYSADSQ